MKVSSTGFIEYESADGNVWRVEDGRALQADFEITGPDGAVLAAMKLWHEAFYKVEKEGDVQTGTVAAKIWKIVCRRYAICPMFGDVDLEMMRPWTAEMISERMAIPVVESNACMVEARSFWFRWKNARSTRTEDSVKPSSNVMEEMSDELIDKLLLREGFAAIHDPAERAFIARRIMEMEDLLNFVNSRSLVRSLITQEAHLFFVIDTAIRSCRDEIRRDSEKQHSTKAQEERLLKLMQTRSTAQAAMQGTRESLGISEDQTDDNRRRLGFQNTVAGLVAACEAYEARGDTALIDGIFTADEVKILTEEFDIRPAQYRFDKVLATPDAIAHLFDPNYASPEIPTHLLKRITMGFRAGLAAARAENGETVADLDPDGRQKQDKEAAAEEAQERRAATHAGIQGAPAAGYVPPKPKARRNSGDEAADF